MAVLDPHGLHERVGDDGADIYIPPAVDRRPYVQLPASERQLVTRERPGMTGNDGNLSLLSLGGGQQQHSRRGGEQRAYSAPP